MAQKGELLSTKSKNGKKTYYAYTDQFGLVKPTESEEMATVKAFSDHPHPGTKTHPEYKGRMANWIKRGGLVSISYKTEEELAAARTDKANKRKEATKAVVERTRKKLLEHPDREFVAKFLENQKRKVESVAAKTTRKRIKAEERVKAILQKAGLKATITAK